MIADALDDCPRCGERERRVEVREDTRGAEWLIECGCGAVWRLVVADAERLEERG